MAEKLTIEQALNNIQQICDNYIGKKTDHIALEQSMAVIRETINKNQPNHTDGK